MHTPKTNSSGSQKRASADGLRRGGVSFPAVQRYQIKNVGGESRRVSDNGNMSVRNNGATDHFFANDSATKAQHVLTDAGLQEDGTHKYKSNAQFIANCGEYANRVFKIIHQHNQLTHNNEKRIKNTSAVDKKIPTQDVNSVFAKAVSGPVNPGIGEAYLAVSGPDDKELVDALVHYNFHWAVVVAKDGSDVITTEAAPTSAHEFFQMYSQVQESQAFRRHYVFSLEKLAESAKIFTATFHNVPKGEATFGGIID